MGPLIPPWTCLRVLLICSTYEYSLMIAKRPMKAELCKGSHPPSSGERVNEDAGRDGVGDAVRRAERGKGVC